MKIKINNCSLLFSVFLFFFLLNCKKDSIKTTATVTIGATTSVTSDAASSGGDVTSDGGSTVTAKGVCWGTNQTPTTSDSKVSGGPGTGSFTSSLTGLNPGTTYTIRAYAINAIGTAYSSQATFTTIALAPVLATTDLSAITSTTATSGGNITADGGSAITARGTCWATTQNPTTASNKSTDGTGTGTFASNLTGLLPGTTYYVKAYATNNIGTTYGNQLTLTTTAVAPVITTTSATTVTSTTATSGGNITTDGGSTVTARGVCWATTQNPTTANSKTTDGTGAGTFTSNLTGLLPGSTYYVKAYATNSIGTTYGNQITVTTTAVAPVLTTTVASAITSTTATSGGIISTDGGSAITARGVCWATTQNPTIASSKTTDGTGPGTFTSQMTGLLPGTTYYVMAYATNSIGTTYGNQITITTTAVAPVLTTTVASAITSTTATSGGNITAEGGSAITARGTCWAITQNPTTASSKTTNGTGIGPFISSLTGLTHGTTYYIRAYATNGIGTSYGGQVTLTTIAEAPAVTTTAVSAVTNTTATSGGSITSDGGSAITVKGVCWATTTGPTISNSKTTDGTGSGIFTSNITGLTSGATYYLRAYATNSIATSYGSEISFTPGTLTDIDGNVYHYITIGTQVWMVENLKTTKYRNGDPITYETNDNNWQNLRTEAYCWYNNNAATYKATYGALYNWWAATDARNIAPVGWHVPTDADWTTLFTLLGGQVLAGGPLKETGTAHWLTPNTGATNTSGFTALGGGTRYGGGGSFALINEQAYWWSSTSYPNNGSGINLAFTSATAILANSWYPMDGFFIRCIKD